MEGEREEGWRARTAEEAQVRADGERQSETGRGVDRAFGQWERCHGALGQGYTCELAGFDVAAELLRGESVDIVPREEPYVALEWHHVPQEPVEERDGGEEHEWELPAGNGHAEEAETYKEPQKEPGLSENTLEDLIIVGGAGLIHRSHMFIAIYSNLWQFIAIYSNLY